MPSLAARAAGIVGIIAAAAGAATPTKDLAPVLPFRSFDRSSQTPLPQSTVMGIAEDARGMLWIATLDGAASFDGRSINRVADVSGAPHGGLLMGVSRRHRNGVLTFGAAGVYLLKHESTWKLIRTPTTIIDAVEDASSTIWALDRNGNLSTFRPGHSAPAWSPVSTEGMPPHITHLAADNDGVILASSGRVIRISSGSRVPVAAGAPIPGIITALHADRDGTTWIGTIGGHVLFAGREDNRWTEVSIPGWDAGRIRCLADDASGRIWAGGPGGAVAVGTARGGWTSFGPDNGLKPSLVDVVTPTRDGTIWFGFNGDGMQQLMSERWTHRNCVDPLLARYGRARVFAISPRPAGGALIAAFDLGLWAWNGSDLRVYGKEQGLTEDVRVGYEPAPGILWAGTRTGLFESRNGGSFRQVLRTPVGLDNPGNFVTTIAPGPDGGYCLGTSNAGIYRLIGKSWQPADDWNRALPDLDVITLFRARDGELWAGTLRGIAIFGKGAPRVLTAASSPGFPRSVSAIAQLPNGSVVVGGSGGLSIETDGTWRSLGHRDGLPGDVVYSVAIAVDGAMWLGTSDGVARLNKGKVEIFDSRNGLLDSECNTGGMLPLPDGGVLVGTMASLAWFHPSAPAAPAPSLTCAWIRTPPDNRIGPGKRNLNISWLAPFLRPYPVEYSYRVPRLEGRWSEPSLGTDLRLGNLSPGLWRVEVRARVGGPHPGAWTDPIALDVEALPKFWETGFARVAATAAAIALVLLAIRWRTRRLARRAADLNAEVERRTAELSQANERLALAKKDLEELARRDPLTHLYNRRAAEERLAEIFSAARRKPAPLAAFLFDLDDFKPLNDRGGHAAGDAVLKATADACRQIFRESDTLVRYGGDEFLVIFSNVTEPEALALARRLEGAIADIPPVPMPNGGAFRVGISGGIAWSPDGAGITGDELLQLADEALYKAKRAGRNRILLASEAARDDTATVPAPS